MCINSHKQRHIFRHILADRTDTLQWESTSVFKASAILICSVVDSTGKERMRQIVMRTMEFDAVKSCFCCTFCCFSIAIYNFFNLLYCNSRKCDSRSHRHITGHQNLCCLVHSDCHTSLPQLDTCFTTFCMNRICQFLKSRNILVLTNRKKSSRCTWCMNRTDFHHI